MTISAVYGGLTTTTATVGGFSVKLSGSNGTGIMAKKKKADQKATTFWCVIRAAERENIDNPVACIEFEVTRDVVKYFRRLLALWERIKEEEVEDLGELGYVKLDANITTRWLTGSPNDTEEEDDDRKLVDLRNDDEDNTIGLWWDNYNDFYSGEIYIKRALNDDGWESVSSDETQLWVNENVTLVVWQEDGMWEAQKDIDSDTLDEWEGILSQLEGGK